MLSQYLNQTVEKLTVGLYMLLFLAPVGYIAFNKVRMASSTHKVEDGTFCFRPAMVVRYSTMITLDDRMKIVSILT